MRYGGNTACVAVEVPGEDPIVFDIGTGLRFWGQTLPQDGSFHGSALVSHMHWDHVQGLPFFVPIDRPGATFDVYGPTAEECSWGQGFANFMRPPYFPVTPSDLRGDIRFHDLNHDGLVLGNAKVTSRPVPHIGPTNGYRIEWNGVTVCYISDHQAPPAQDEVHPNVLELADGADLLIHDAQYTPAEWDQKSHWGHCTVDYALLVAKEAGAKTLALFHHDPAHDDDDMDRLLEKARTRAAAEGVHEVVAAYEGLTISYERGANGGSASKKA
jgi:phosphoribosyl 1,2-cyclic phosphodiesterase